MKYFKDMLDDFWDETNEMKGISMEIILAKAKVKYDLIMSQQKWGASQIGHSSQGQGERW